MLKQSDLIIFTGLPGTGKTSISKKVADKLSLPLVAKDKIKELMFDELGWSDRNWSTKLASATFKIMEYVTEQQLKAGHTLILEGNFKPSVAEVKFRSWLATYRCNIIQIVCRADLDVLARRFYERNLADRHPGHADIGTVETFRRELAARIEKGEDQPLGLNGSVLIVDTTNFSNVKLDELATWVRQSCNQKQADLSLNAYHTQRQFVTLNRRLA